MDVLVTQEHRVLGELLAAFVTAEAHDVNTLFVLVPDAVGGKLESAIGTGEMFLALFCMFFKPVLLETVEVAGRLVFAGTVLVHAVESALLFCVLEVDFWSGAKFSFGRQRHVVIVNVVLGTVVSNALLQKITRHS